MPELQPVFKRDIILHIEDDDLFRKKVYEDLHDSEPIKKEYGSAPLHVECSYGSKPTESQPLDAEGLEREILKIQAEVEKGVPLVVSVASAQVARAFLAQYVPGAIISDTSFPLNGRKIAEWLVEHGFKDYAMIGLSNTSIDGLRGELRDFFIGGNSRYFYKLNYEYDKEDIMQQVIRNRWDNTRRYAPAQPQQES